MTDSTPVIVRYYSLSEPSSSNDPGINYSNKTSTNHTIGSRVPGRHSSFLQQQLSPKRHKPTRGLQHGEDGLHDLSVHRPRSDTNPYTFSFKTQPNHVKNDAAGVVIDYKQNQNHSTAVLPSLVHEKYMPSVDCQSMNFSFGPHENRYQANCTQTKQRLFPFNQNYLEPTDTSESMLYPRITHVPCGVQRKTYSPVDGHSQVGPGPMISYNWPYEQFSSVRRPTVKIYEQRRILVGKFYRDIPSSVGVARSKQKSNISYAHRREPYREEHSANAEVFKTPTSQNGRFQIRLNQNDISVRSEKRKSHQPCPRRLECDRIAQVDGSEDNQQVRNEEEHQEEPFNNRYAQEKNASSPQNSSRPKEVCRGRGGEVKVRNKKSEMCTLEDIQTTVPTRFNSTSRCDENFLKNTSSRSRIFRSEIPSVILPPLNYSSEGTGTNEQCDSFFSRGPFHDAPKSGATGSSHCPTVNHIMLAGEMNSSYQSKTSEKIPFNFRPEWNVTKPFLHSPASMIGRDRKSETVGKGGLGYNSGYGKCPSVKRMTFLDPSKHNMFKRSVVFTFPSEMNSGSSVERPEENMGYHTLQGKDKHSSKNSKSPPLSLPSDHGNVSSTIVEDSGESKKANTSDQPIQYAKTSGSTNESVQNRPNEKREAFANYLDPTLKERRFVCRYCDNRFAHFSTLQSHLRTHTGDKPFQCKFCSRRFAQSGVLKTHLRTHTGDKPFVCMYCRKGFAQSTTLTNHLRTHTGETPYACNICSKSFSQPSTLRKHKLSHTKERPYPCKFCGKAFAQRSTLTNHVRLHTGQRPFKCHFCEKSFTQLSTLDRHLRLHSTVSLKPHQCQYCTKSFSYTSNLLSHMRVQHEEHRLLLE